MDAAAPVPVTKAGAGTHPDASMEPEPSAAGADRLEIRLLGPLQVRRGGTRVDLPPSRKVRALLAYLALAPRPVARGALADLLWDLPNDPRGELRWSLSKLRSVLDDDGRARVRADDAQVALDLAGAEVDALEVQRAAEAGLDTLPEPALAALQSRLAGGAFLQQGDVERSATFSAWLVAQRRRFRALELAVLEHRARALPAGSAARQAVVESWLERAPFDQQAHRALFDVLARQGRWHEGEEHLQRTMRQHDREGQDWTPLGHAWREARRQHAPAGAAHGTGASANAGPMPDGPHAGPSSRIETALPHADRSTAVDAAALVALVQDGEVRARAAGTVDRAGSADTTRPTARPSIVVMPFEEPGLPATSAGRLGQALAFDLTTRLAKLRSLFVIAQGTSVALGERRIGAEDAGRRLQVDYVANGTLLRQGTRRIVQVQLAELRSARVLWADEIETRAADTLALLETLGDRIVAALSQQIEQAERSRAILKPPNSLDAWEAHHRGLWHMYRFNEADNALAQQFFATASRLDPSFARPYVGLSFTHFQNAFLEWHDRARETELAYRTAAQALLADEVDPLAHWAMGRALWLRGGRQAESISELDTAVDLSPNFALGHYTLAFVHCQSGEPEAALAAAERSRALSPFDPMLFGVFGSQAMALMRLGRHDEAADAALKAAARPNAHLHIRALAMHALSLAGRVEEARPLAAALRQEAGHYDLDAFFRAFRLDAQMQARVREAARRAGLA